MFINLELNLKTSSVFCLITIFLVSNYRQTLAADKKFSTGTINSRITNGQNAVHGAYPYQVSLWWGFPPEIPSSHSCGGAILNNEWILTAGHCFTDLPTYGTITVIAGKYFISGTDITQQSSAIKRTIIHPSYQGGANPHDLALVQLETPFTYTSYIAAIALPAHNAAHTGNAVLTGWGSISFNETVILPTVLQTATVPIINNTICYDALYGFVGDTNLQSTNICTGPLDKSKIAFCAGDSGGPLAQLTNGYWQLIGIVSWGLFPCGEAGIPSVYVRVSNYTNWIADEIAANY